MNARRPRTAIAVIGVLLGILLPAMPARAHGMDHLLDEARELDLPEVRRLIELHEEVDRLFATYQRLEAEAGRGWMVVIEAERSAAEAEDLVDAAELRLADRVRTAYEFGPGVTIEALLRAGTFADLASISIYSERTIALEDGMLRESVVAEATLQAQRALARATRAWLAPRLDDLRHRMDRLLRKEDEMLELAEAASVADAELRAQRQAIAAAAARQGTWDIVGRFGEDQSWLLALLGPTGGRSCDTPEGLVATGETFQGYASWYGWEFGGQPTATGAIFDPRLFTAAHRSLPFGTFLRVHHGDRCAIVLVNDRGPYGRLERVIDLSQASAEYLGVGVSWVLAEILVPTQGAPE
ncbi:MAG TPA: RlpA-like double-psi beta-barrel domain-containing protein [Actinomycetota bacterium]|nr:RlpA-like double-psi beta-barrel domain-containing protein [Actinomycetota bacterium]